MLVLRKLVKRIKGLAHNQFTGTADILETMQESLQGIRTVKAFTLELTMRDRIDASIAAVERNANKMARVSNRSSPLMETLGGFAIAGGLMYGGYSGVALGATPGPFFSFLTAFLLAYDPGHRHAISGVSRNSLRQQTAYVGQDVYLFRATIRENIAFGKAGATEDEIVAAAKAACAHEFIMGFPLGYDTPVGEHGTQLSGGQRQRIAVARALIKNAPIILLDEATAALDSESEKQVQEAIEHLCQNRTTIVIAHRLHTIMHADAILVVEGAEIVERGRHDDLFRRGGRYASFFRLQQRDTAALAPLSAPP